ncbi:MAG TPA: DUF6152 family protein [Vicinamibacterales bacterium]|nr:DUF6152 family protein [Vicinamibacterales bacterium]
MMYRVIAVLVIVMAVALLGSSRLSAHHSLASQFDEGKPLTLQGVITKVEWVNPHVWVHIDVKDTSGAVEQWVLETLPPATLRKGGLRSDMLGKGETVTVLAYRARNESKLAFLRKITFADGREVVVWVGDIKTAK